ncbi:MAG: HAD hydrolase-like protein [Rhodobacteraceae bacterium]|nr:HAD hydrolase-like protein [Paracoccaceae bacterium]
MHPRFQVEKEYVVTLQTALSPEEIERLKAGILCDDELLSITRIEACYAPGQGIDHPENYRRKPEPGMITDAAQALGLDLTRSWMIGDRWRDIDCGKRAGLRTLFIDFGYAEELRSAPDHIVQNFAAAAGIILAATSR